MRLDKLDKISLLNPDVGSLDDFVIFRNNNVEAYQIKHYSTNITYNNFISTLDKKGEPKDEESPMLQLVNSWRKIKQKYPQNNIKILWVSTQGLSDRNEKIYNSDKSVKFKSFFQEILKKKIEDPKDSEIPAKYSSIWDHMISAVGLNETEIEDFFKSLNLHFQYELYENAVTDEQQKKQLDYDHIVGILFKIKSRKKNKGALELSKTQIIEKLGWQDRFTSNAILKFPEPLIQYEPITETIKEIISKIEKKNSGYLGLIGSPGTGKSTLLDHIFRNPSENTRIFYYFAYSPVTHVNLRNIVESKNFLKHLIFEIRKYGFEITRIPSEIQELRNEFNNLLLKLEKDYIKTGIKNIFIIDGLDHIPREFNPQESLLEEFPDPKTIPDGILFLLGTQTFNLNQIPSSVKNELDLAENIIKINPISKPSFNSILTNEGMDFNPRIIDKFYNITKGNPLYVQYLIRKYKSESEPLIESFLDSQFSFDKDINQYYSRIWNQIESEPSEVELFGIISRLERLIYDEFILHIGGSAQLNILSKKYQFLFQRKFNTTSFFHNSFRNFCIEKTSQINGIPNSELDRFYHKKIVEHYSSYTGDPIIKCNIISHLYLLGDTAQIFKISNQDWYRDQFLKFRPKEWTQTEIKKLLRTTLEEENYLIFLRGILSLQENRNHSFHLESSSIISLLLAKNKIQEAYLIANNSDNEFYKKKALMKIAKLFYDNYNKDISFELMKKAEPTDFICKHKWNHFSTDEEKYVKTWFSIGIHYYNPDYLFDLIINSEIENHAKEDKRFNLLHILLKELLFDGQIIRFEYFLKKIKKINENWYINILASAWDIVKFHNEAKSEEYFQIFASFLQKYKLNYSISNFLSVCKGFIEMNDKSTALNFFNVIEFTNRAGYYYGFDQFQYVIDYIDIHLQLKPHTLEKLRTKIIFDDMEEQKKELYKLLIILGEIKFFIKSEHINKFSDTDCEKFSTKLVEFLITSKKPNPGKFYFNQGMLEDFIIYTLNVLEEIGLDYLNIFFKVINSFLNSFSVSEKLKILTPFTRFEFSHVNLKPIFKEIEEQLFQEDVYSNVENCQDLIKNWALLGEDKESERLQERIFDLSFSLGYRKDYQMEWWVKWLKLYLNKYPEKTEEYISYFVKILIHARKTTEGHGILDTTRDLIKIAYHFNPKYSLKLFAFLKDENLIGHFQGITAMIEQALDEKDFPYQSIINYVIYILIPLSENTFPVLIRKFLQTLYKLSKIDKKTIKLLIKQIKIYSINGEKEKWLLSCAIALNSLGILDQFSLNLEELLEKVKSTDIYYDQQDYNPRLLNELLSDSIETKDDEILLNLKEDNLNEIRELSNSDTTKLQNIVKTKLKKNFSAKFVDTEGIIWKLEILIPLLMGDEFVIDPFWIEIEEYLNTLFKENSLDHINFQLQEDDVFECNEDIFAYLTLWGLEIPITVFYYHSMQASINLLNTESIDLCEIMKYQLINHDFLRGKILIILNAVENKVFITKQFNKFFEEDFKPISFFCRYLISKLREEDENKDIIKDYLPEPEIRYNEVLANQIDENERKVLDKNNLRFSFLKSKVFFKIQRYDEFLSQMEASYRNLWYNYRKRGFILDYFNLNSFSRDIQVKPNFINYLSEPFKIDADTFEKVLKFELPIEFDDKIILASKINIVYHQYRGRKYFKEILIYRAPNQNDLKIIDSYDLIQENSLSKINEKYLYYHVDFTKYLLPGPLYSILLLNPKKCLELGWIQDNNKLGTWYNDKGKVMISSISWQDGLSDFGNLYETYTSSGTMLVISKIAFGEIFRKEKKLNEFQTINHDSSKIHEEKSFKIENIPDI